MDAPTSTLEPPRAPRSAMAARSGVLHLCNGLDPVRDGGMVPSILGMTGALAAAGSPTRIVTPTPSRTDRFRMPAGVALAGPEADLEAAVRSAGVLHMHGLWQGHTRRGARAARRAGVPYLIAAHGMAEPWALRQKALKKRAYLALVEGRNLRAACLHALTRPEVDHLRALAPAAPVCLVPNGVDLAPFDDLPPRSEFEAEHPALAGKFLVLFFGRLHAKKGLDLLARAVADAGGNHPDLHVILAGTDDGALAPLRRQAEELGVADRFTALGHLAGAEARRVWGAADAFALPSYSEGFSMAVLEALAARRPVLLTHACHFPELAEARGAIAVDPTSEGVSAGLRDLLAMPEPDRAAMAGRGRALVEARYTWDRQADRLAAVYRWVAHGGPAPDAVVTPGARA